MARPRVFVSSTYYDLRHLRSSTENFIDQLGYEPVLSEKDSIAYLPDAPLDESCYREARNCDIFVLIIGGRYGSPVSGDKKPKTSNVAFFERYESITRREYESAAERDIPIYILMDSSVDAEYQTYLKNKENTSVHYAHVDSVNIFHFIESIRERQKNNPIKLFSRYSEIEIWLREQWAGTFRELIQRMSSTSRIQDIDSKVIALAETTETLKRYLEQVVAKVSPEKDEAVQLIKEENARLREARNDAEFRAYPYINHLSTSHRKNFPDIQAALRSSGSYTTFMEELFKHTNGRYRIPACAHGSKAFSDLNEVRAFLELPAYDRADLEILKLKHKSDGEGAYTTDDPKSRAEPPSSAPGRAMRRKAP